jgi:hypothetical protein
LQLENLMKESVTLFEYRRRKAEAAMQKAQAQQQVLDFLLAAGYQYRYAEQVAEAGQPLLRPGDMSADEFTRINELLASVGTLEAAGYTLEQEVILL